MRIDEPVPVVAQAPCSSMNLPNRGKKKSKDAAASQRCDQYSEIALGELGWTIVHTSRQYCTAAIFTKWSQLLVPSARGRTC